MKILITLLIIMFITGCTENEDTAVDDKDSKNIVTGQPLNDLTQEEKEERSKDIVERNDNSKAENFEW